MGPDVGPILRLYTGFAFFFSNPSGFDLDGEEVSLLLVAVLADLGGFSEATSLVLGAVELNWDCGTSDLIIAFRLSCSSCVTVSLDTLHASVYYLCDTLIVEQLRLIALEEETFLIRTDELVPF